jgi:hypothetical protein
MIEIYYFRLSMKTIKIPILRELLCFRFYRTQVNTVLEGNYFTDRNTQGVLKFMKEENT